MEKLCEVDPETVQTDLMGRSGEITTLWCYPSELKWPFFMLTQLFDVDFVGRVMTLGAKVPGS